MVKTGLWIPQDGRFYTKHRYSSTDDLTVQQAKYRHALELSVSRGYNNTKYVCFSFFIVCRFRKDKTLPLLVFLKQQTRAQLKEYGI